MTDPNRPSPRQRGYDSAHRARRRRALAYMPEGHPCPRCGQPMYRHQQLDLDHTDTREGYLGLSHARCNRAAGGAQGWQKMIANATGQPAKRKSGDPRTEPCPKCGLMTCDVRVMDRGDWRISRCW